MRIINQITNDLHNLAIKASTFLEQVDDSNEDPEYIESCFNNTKNHLAELASLGVELRLGIAANNTTDLKNVLLVYDNEDKYTDNDESEYPTQPWPSWV